MLLTIVTFLVILTIMVLIHEAGHFFVAKIVGVNVEEFGLGLPPRIFGKKFGSTIYSLNWLPIGGFVKLSGEDSEDGISAKLKNKSQYFWARSKKERAAILTAGVIMNFVLAVGITTFLLLTGVEEPTGYVRIDRVVSGSPADIAGLKVNDKVTELKDYAEDATAQRVSPHSPDQLIKYVSDRKGKQIVITLIRDAKPQSIVVTPRTVIPKGEGALGIAITTDVENHVYPWTAAPQKALSINLSRARDMLTSLGGVVSRLVTLRKPDAEVAGPIGIARVTGEAVKLGWKAVLELASILSLNLAVLNVLPIPALDGGRLAFVVFEKLLGRRVRPAFEKSTHQIGMLILMVLILLVSINDIMRLVRGG